jgi:hypothetical protein
VFLLFCVYGGTQIFANLDMRTYCPLRPKILIFLVLARTLL